MKILFLLVALVCIKTSLAQHPFNNVISSLSKFQTPSGGFKNTPTGSTASIAATADGLFLASVYGQENQVKKESLQSFLHKSQNGDYGYGDSQGLASNLEAVKGALLSYHFVGADIPNPTNIAAYVKTLMNEETGLFSSRIGEEPSLSATATAFDVLSLLGESKRTYVNDIKAPLRSFLESHLSSSDDSLYFDFDTEMSHVKENYYGILLASHVDFDFVNFGKWGNFILSLQESDGGFAACSNSDDSSLENTIDAINSLHILEEESDSDLMEEIDFEALASFVRDIPTDLNLAADAHRAVLLVGNYLTRFDNKVHFETDGAPVKDTIVQGTKFSPILSVNPLSGLYHSGLTAKATIEHSASDTKLVVDLEYNSNKRAYTTSEVFDSTGKLGSLIVSISFSDSVLTIGESSHEIVESHEIGYGIAVDPTATLEVTGKSIKEGEQVSVGTDFKFIVSLNNRTNDNFFGGDFSVIFSVLDSSLVQIYSDTLDCESNSDEIEFEYDLESSKIPAGALTFRFEVSADNHVHTSRDVVYYMGIPMVATEISVAKSNYKIGETIKIEMTPATFPDLRTVVPFGSTDGSGKSIEGARNFQVVLTSPSGTTIRTINGVSNNGKYTFEVPATNTLESIGTNMIHFSYKPSIGDSISLQNYDSSLGELYEDASVLNFTVDAVLVLDLLSEKPSANDFFYGNDITFQFRVKDISSNQYVTLGNIDESNVFLTLKHVDEVSGRPFASVNQAAEFVDNAFVINWGINPNAVKGSGFLTLSAKNPDGEDIPLYVNNKAIETVKYDIFIGGEIEVESKPYANGASSLDETVFVSEFTLSCQGKQLKDALLRCSVERQVENDFERVAFASVATNDEGAYSVSWTVPQNSIESGSYRLNFFREVDRVRAAESKEIKRQRRLKETELTGETVEEEEEEEELPSLFHIDLDLKVEGSQLPIKSEFIVITIFVAAFVSLFTKKISYE